MDSANSEFQDKQITCEECDNSFKFSVDEQQFYQEKGFTHDPKRCKPCRQDRKNRSGHSRVVQFDGQGPLPRFAGGAFTRPDDPRTGQRGNQGGNTRGGQGGNQRGDNSGRRRGPSFGGQQVAWQSGGAPLFKADFGPSPTSRSAGRGRGGGSWQANGDQGDRRHDAVCSDCSTPTTVPFKPNGVQPVYCRTCLPNHKTRRSR